MKKMFKVTVSLAVMALMCGGSAFAKKAKQPKPKSSLTDKTYVYQMYDDIIPGAAGIDEEEAKAKYNMVDAELEKWAPDGGKTYLHTGDLYSKFQYEDGTGDWAEDIMSHTYEKIDCGDGDYIIAFNLTMAKHIGWILNFSEQGAKPKSVKNAVVKFKIYIPAEYAAEDARELATFRFNVRDTNWGLTYLDGPIDHCALADIGAGWHVCTIDFANKTYELGKVKGEFKAGFSRGKHNAIELQFDGKGGKAVCPVYFDWLTIEGLE